MDGQLRVGQLITSLTHGGAEHLLVDLIDTADEVEFIVGFFGSDDALADAIQDAGAEVHHFNESFRFDPIAFIRCVQFLRQQSLDVLHLHLPYAQSLGRIAGTIVGIDAIISTKHAGPGYLYQITRATERITRPLDDATVAVSQGRERAYTGTAHEPNDFGHKWCTIYNGIDVSRFADKVSSSNSSAIREQLGIGMEETVLLNVGRYVPTKGQKELIRGFSTCNVDGHLVIVGHGELKNDLQAEAKRLNVEQSVHITGRVPNTHPYYKIGDIFISAARSEGLPITFLEAMAAELPIIAAEISGVDEIVVDGQTGFLYSPNDVDEMARAIALLDNRERCSQYGLAGKNRVKKVFSIEQMAESYIELYHKTLTD